MENINENPQTDKFSFDLEKIKNSPYRNAFDSNVNTLIERVNKIPETDRPRTICLTLVMDIEPFLRDILPGSEDHIRCLHAGIKAAIDYMQIPENAAIEDDLGHTLRKAVTRLLSEPKAVNSDGLRKIVEFMAKNLEAFGKFEEAYDMYRVSFPEKYNEKLTKANPDKKDFPEISDNSPYFHKKEGGLASDEIKQMVSILMDEIKDDPIMQVNAEKEMIELYKKCREVINSNNL